MIVAEFIFETNKRPTQVIYIRRFIIILKLYAGQGRVKDGPHIDTYAENNKPKTSRWRKLEKLWSKIVEDK